MPAGRRQHSHPAATWGAGNIRISPESVRRQGSHRGGQRVVLLGSGPTTQGDAQAFGTASRASTGFCQLVSRARTGGPSPSLARQVGAVQTKNPVASTEEGGRGFFRKPFEIVPPPA
jgi:hypothetical protein